MAVVGTANVSRVRGREKFDGGHLEVSSRIFTGMMRRGVGLAFYHSNRSGSGDNSRDASVMSYINH